MLGRTANGIFWMMRYLERAENTARLLDAGFRLALTKGQNAARDEWRSVLVTMGHDAAFTRRNGEYTGPAVTNFILRGADNPGSVLAMIDGARTNARTVRTAITREVWEATNESWMVLGDMLADTPLAKIDDIEFVRTVAVARITMPLSMVRLSAGRESMSEATQALCFMAGANSIFTGDKLLTAPNAGDDADAAMLARLGLKPMRGAEPMRTCANLEAAE